VKRDPTRVIMRVNFIRKNKPRKIEKK
jgi:hypothetical protein